ncbi:MAG: branched-chain amino acid ABC transporter permease [Firmicutes bacterium]|jgi:branched-chain amino acid transport system permease protein|nr:branched-chain amino acid ABC transporter permease [Bacillota bacterium]
MAELAIVLQQIVAGLALGSIYGLVALGYNFIFNAVGIVNLAQGDFVMLGGYIYGGTLTLLLGLPFLPALLLTAIAMAIFGIVSQRIVYYPLRDAHPRMVMLSTIALGIFLKNISLIAWGTYPVSVSGLFGQRGLRIAGVSILYQYIFILVCVIILLAIQQYFFKKTTLGKSMRAVAQDRLAAMLMGIDAYKMIAITFAYSSTLAAIGGVLLAPVFMVSQVLANVGLKGFAACVIGGWGDITGAVIGGLVVGLVEVFSASYISSVYKDAIVFAILIGFLIFRPQGILGRATEVSL